ncbi:N-acetylmuramoyl-L-alanine amidase [hydrothermal vent metagenome]|uniref:N-acetylmuramoyl-L-alanine amidase n=1 Tax=hydrothermal vent metagenome TaxID=652676 RepID=A0A3B1CLE6_9ZZZZ
MLYRHILSAAVFLPFILFSLAYGQGDLSLTDDLDDLADVAPAIKVIVDPGHGGRDLGARSPKHILEKNIILKLSKLIQQRLSSNESLDVIPTRSEDRDITVLERIKFANSSRGDLFIGLHADGGMGPRAHPIKIFICEYGQNEPNKKTAGEIDNVWSKHNVWSSLNYPFKEQNLALAEAIKRELEKTGAGREIEIESSDKLLLGGLSMPAVLIEPVDLSNPADEIRLENEVYITRISDAIATAVEVYLQDAGKL